MRQENYPAQSRQHDGPRCGVQPLSHASCRRSTLGDVAAFEAGESAAWKKENHEAVTCPRALIHLMHTPRGCIQWT